jgi:hypothetical protein
MGIALNIGEKSPAISLSVDLATMGNIRHSYRGSVDLARAGNWFLGILCVGLLGTFIYYWSGESEETKKKRAEGAEKERLVTERRKANRAQQCGLVTEALDVVAARGRADLAQLNNGVPACRRIEVEDCGYKVELLYELQATDRAPLTQQLEKIGDDCDRELEFATKHGLAAFRDHHKLLTEALENARDEFERSDIREPGPDYDFGARGRR